MKSYLVGFIISFCIKQLFIHTESLRVWKMPVVLRVRGYKFWFYEADLAEPIHVHVGKEGKEAKFWIEPIAIARAGRFRDHELKEIERIVREFHEDILAAWSKEQKKHGRH